MRRTGLRHQLTLIALAIASLTAVAGDSPLVHAESTAPVTVVTIRAETKQTNLARLGVNLGPQGFYGSLQILKNLVSRNPGFESQEWQTIVQCTRLQGDVCADGLSWNRWPDGFLDGFQFEVLSGKSMGATGSVLHSVHAQAGKSDGFTVQLGTVPIGLAAGDSLAIRGKIAGQATFGWTVRTTGGARVTGETSDLSPNTPGLQALELSAAAAGQKAAVSAYTDSTLERPYLRLRGDYVVRFRAKSRGESHGIDVQVQRNASGPERASFLKQHVLPSPAWKDYELRFTAGEGQDTPGTLSLQFSVAGGDVLLDDVSLEEAKANGTSFRNDVLTALQRLRPGVLRWMDSGENWGSSLSNMLRPAFGRRPAGYSPRDFNPSDISIGLEEFLVLSEKVGAEPWFTVPMGWTANDARDLMEYLAGPVSTPFGKLRAQRGHPVPWSTAFPIIHLEYGNEAWNTVQHGAILGTAEAYPQRANFMAGLLRNSPWFAHGHFDLIANGQAVNPWLTKHLAGTLQGYDTVAIAPYTFTNFRDASSTESVYGPMLAEAEMLVRGVLQKQAEAALSGPRPLQLAVYEVNIGTTAGTVSQADLDSAIPSLGAGLSTVTQMLMMQRDLKIRTQCLFQLTGRNSPFHNEAANGNQETSPVWPLVVDMGGPANRVRPVFLAAELANEAMLPNQLDLKISGSNPTWNQPSSPNGGIVQETAHEIQAFAYSEGSRRAVILLNLSRTRSQEIRLEGPEAPTGQMDGKVLSSGHISDGNQNAETVRIQPLKIPARGTTSPTIQLPPFSMVILTYQLKGLVAAAPIPKAGR